MTTNENLIAELNASIELLLKAKSEGSNHDDTLCALETTWGSQPKGEFHQRLYSLQRRAEAEVRKYNLIAEKIRSITAAATPTSTRDAQRIAVAYLRTDPAEPLTDCFSSAFPELAFDAQQTILHNDDLKVLRSPVIRDFWEDPTSPDLLRRVKLELQSLSQRHDANQLMHFGIKSDNVDEVNTAMALVTWEGRYQFAPLLLNYAAVSHPSGHHAVVGAALLDPPQALQTLGKILADAAFEATLGNAELHEIDDSAQRARILIVARTVIPKIGSPVPNVESMNVTEKMANLIDWVHSMWDAWLLIKKQ